LLAKSGHDWWKVKKITVVLCLLAHEEGLNAV